MVYLDHNETVLSTSMLACLLYFCLVFIKMYHLQRLFISWLIALIISRCPCVRDINPYMVRQDVKHQTIIKTVDLEV